MNQHVYKLWFFTDREQTWVNLAKVSGDTPKSSEGNAVDASLFERFKSNGDVNQRYRIFMDDGHVKIDDSSVDALYAVLCRIDKNLID